MGRQQSYLIVYQSCCGIGHDPAEANIAFYAKGTVSGTNTLAAVNTTTPDSRWFYLSLTNSKSIVILSL